MESKLKDAMCPIGLGSLDCVKESTMENKQFEEWLKEDQNTCFHDFDLLEESQKWGVYLEFFDSVGYVVQVFNTHAWKWVYQVDSNKPNKHGSRHEQFETRQEAQQEAIKKAFEILEDGK